MIALELLRTFWKPLAGVLLAVALYFAWTSYIASVERRGYDLGHIAGAEEGYGKGEIDGRANAIKERQAADDEMLAAATTKARADELAALEKLHKESVKRQEEKAKYEKTIDDLRADARAGNSGMRLPAGTCNGGPGLPADAAPASAAAAGGPVDPAAGIQLLPQTSEALLDAAADLRQGLRKSNELIRLYEQCRATANAL